MQLLFLLLLLVVPYFGLTILGNLAARLWMRPSLRARVGLSTFFSFTAIGHFVRTEQMSAMLPPATPYRIALIYITGVLELMGAIGVWIPALTKLTGICLILMLLAVLPANIYAAMERVDFGGHVAGPVYLWLRLPFQLFVIWWTYIATEQNWFHRLEEGRTAG